MAAAGLSRSRGGAGVRGLLITFTLLCLVSFSHSLVNNEDLNKLLKVYQDAQQFLNKIKAHMNSTSDLLNEGSSVINSIVACMRKAVKKLPDNFPPVENFVATLQGYMETLKAHVNSQNEMFFAQIKEGEENMEQMMKAIRSLQQCQAEL